LGGSGGRAKYVGWRNKMPSIEDNLTQWSSYEWADQGDEWSEFWGGTDFLWFRTIYPRIRNFVPADTILEIAPGYGRCTQYLLSYCHKLVIVDLTAKCIEACKKRFKDKRHIKYHVNDGRSLEMVLDDSIDFAFSWDSLVHVENDVIESYIRQLSKKLRSTGVGFIHHSNIGSYINKQTGELTVANQHWRGTTVSADLVAEYCEKYGLYCMSQEKINWGDTILTDCISLFSKVKVATTIVEDNDRFYSEEVGYSRYLSRIYSVPRPKSVNMGKMRILGKALGFCKRC